MTIKEAIDWADALRPNKLAAALKYKWFSDLDGRIQTEVWGLDPEDTGPYTASTDEETELLVPSPYDGIYVTYLCSMIDWGNGQYSDYNNGKAAYNDAFTQYAAWYRRRHLPP